MDIPALQRQLRTFARERQWGRYHSPKNLVMALSVEVAELMEHFQWLTEDESRQPEQAGADIAGIGEEVADVLLYLLQLADQLGIDLETAATHKLARNARKHPVPGTRVGGQASPLPLRGPTVNPTMTVYERMTVRAVQLLAGGLAPGEAWKQAGLVEAEAHGTRNKPCPRSAFVSLAEHGHIQGYSAAPTRPLTQNAAYCLTGAALLVERPELATSRTRLWEAIRERTGVSRQGQNGVVDVLLALHRNGQLVTGGSGDLSGPASESSGPAGLDTDSAD
ncbi:nucleotide pyrophosphohydrolase [Deinococcus hohokamensis]|uniref:Nucleotide pyrophosphohydrolase n=1 Tax=Deinococcus hohokamensis TaxID=309883 RepID=A0ABV9ICE4_9DEIO